VESASAGGADLATIFRLASMTKAVTSVAVMQLVEQGRIGLDVPAATYLERLRDLRVLDGFDPNGTPRLRAPRSAPTPRQLLTHTAGFSYAIWSEDMQRMAAFLGMDAAAGIDETILDLPLIADPGSRWEYGSSTDVLGVMVEAVTGDSLEAYFAEHLLEPLGMCDTHFNVPDQKIHRVLPVFARSDSGLAEVMQGVPRVRFFSGGGGLASTTSDYARFLQALLRGGELDGRRILAAETVDLMAQKHTGKLIIPPMRTAYPFLSADCDFFPGQPKHWGLGFLINATDVPGGRRAGSMAWAGVFNTHYWVDRRAGFAGLLLTQLLPFCDPAFLTLYADVERAMYQAD
jgi:CubicO group peptidase (beta-lactamase class C family)